MFYLPTRSISGLVGGLVDDVPVHGSISAYLTAQYHSWVSVADAAQIVQVDYVDLMDRQGSLGIDLILLMFLIAIWPMTVMSSLS